MIWNWDILLLPSSLSAVVKLALHFWQKKYGSNHSKSRISTYCWNNFAGLGLQRSSYLWADQQVLPRNFRSCRRKYCCFSLLIRLHLWLMVIIFSACYGRGDVIKLLALLFKNLNYNQAIVIANMSGHHEVARILKSYEKQWKNGLF